MGIIANQAMRSDRFHFGFCNAVERSALESHDAIRSAPTKDAAITTADEAYAVMAGVHAALAALTGDVDSAMHTALEFGLSQGSREGLRDLVEGIRREDDGLPDDAYAGGFADNH